MAAGAQLLSKAELLQLAAVCVVMDHSWRSDGVPIGYGTFQVGQ
jgi:hypothetical protein